MKETEPRLRTLLSNWQGAVLVCRKCSKKIGGGFGPKGKQSLAKALRKAKHSRKGRKGSFGVAEVPCLGVCPRDAVTVIDGSAPGRWLVVPKGADVEAVLASLSQP
jgi:predicted metal-binding protein